MIPENMVLNEYSVQNLEQEEYLEEPNKHPIYHASPIISNMNFHK